MATASLFPSPAGTSAAKRLVSATVEAIASKLGLPLRTQTGAPRFTGHSFRATGAVYMASSGIDIWRIQLHGRWGSAAVLRYVKLAPLSSSIAVETSLGRDLRTLRQALAGAQAASSDGPGGNRALITEHAILGLPALEDITGGTRRCRPAHDEVLVINATTELAHALRRPISTADAGDITSLRSDPNADLVTACGWHFADAAQVRIMEASFPGPYPRPTAGISV